MVYSLGIYASSTMSHYEKWVVCVLTLHLAPVSWLSRAGKLDGDKEDMHGLPSHQFIQVCFRFTMCTYLPRSGRKLDLFNLGTASSHTQSCLPGSDAITRSICSAHALLFSKYQVKAMIFFWVLGKWYTAFDVCCLSILMLPLLVVLLCMLQLDCL